MVTEAALDKRSGFLIAVELQRRKVGSRYGPRNGKVVQ
jgi:hypothetical protein